VHVAQNLRTVLGQPQDDKMLNTSSIPQHRSKDASGIFLTLMMVLVIITGLQNRLSVQASTTPQSVSLPPMSLTLVAANGTQLVLNSNEVGGLPSYRAFGGFKNVLGNIKGLGNYTGVPLTTLCNLAGGINNGEYLLVKASDNYTMLFSYAQVNGIFVTYNPTTGQEVQHLKPLTPILAYYKNDANLSYNDGGPLRLAIVGPEGLATDSIYWVKWVIRLEIAVARHGGGPGARQALVM
jgi:hypothetical protein